MGKRAERLAVQISREIGNILLLEMRDPRLGFVTVSRVEIDQEIAVAKVYVSIMGDDKERKGALIALNRSSGHVRSNLAKKLHIRQVPEIRFVLDLNLDHSDKINNILDGIREKEQDLRNDIDAEGGEK
jgi:ribosome-binding factor A